jgi:putative membrane protein
MTATAQAWAWQPHLATWLIMAATVGAVVGAHRRALRSAAHPVPWSRAERMKFGVGIASAALALTWPIADLAAHWSLCALVLQRSLLILAVAPMLLAGLPFDVVRALSRPALVDAALLRVSRPPIAVICVTALVVVPMAPPLVAAQSSSLIARGVFDLVAVAAGLILWLPVIGRVPGIPRPKPMIRMVYLVAQAVVPVFLSFIFILAVHPLYPAFAGSTQVVGLRPLNDQQVAGFISKLSFLLTLLIAAAVILYQSPDSDDDLGPEDPLVWADVERQFERVDRQRDATGGRTPEANADVSRPGANQEATSGGSTRPTTGSQPDIQTQRPDDGPSGPDATGPSQDAGETKSTGSDGAPDSEGSGAG